MHRVVAEQRAHGLAADASCLQRRARVTPISVLHAWSAASRSENPASRSRGAATAGSRRWAANA
jgi:hypothetical protein